MYTTCGNIYLFYFVFQLAAPKDRDKERKGDEKEFEIKFEFDPKNWMSWLPLAAAVALGYWLTRSSDRTRQITWQEFRVNYLEKGEVSVHLCLFHLPTSLAYNPVLRSVCVYIHRWIVCK